MRTARRWLVAATAGVVLFLSLRSAWAQDLEWVAPPECPDATELARRVTEIAGKPIGIRGRVRVVRTGDTFRAELQSFTEAGALRERELSAATCDVLVDAIATVFVASHVEETATPAPAPAPETASASPSRDASPTRTPAPLHVAVGARGLVDRGLLPETALGAAVDAAFGSERFRIEVRAAGLMPTTATSALGASGELHAFIGEAMMCGGVALAGFRLGGCAGMTVALLRGRGVDVGEPRQEDRVVPAPRIGADVRWPADGAFAVRGDVSGRLALARPEFSVANDGPLHRPASVAVQLLLGPELRF